VTTQGTRGTDSKLTVLKGVEPEGGEEEKEEELPGVSAASMWVDYYGLSVTDYTFSQAQTAIDLDKESPLYCYMSPCPEQETQPPQSQDSNCRPLYSIEALSMVAGAVSCATGLYNISKLGAARKGKQIVDLEARKLAADKAAFQAQKEEWATSAGISQAFVSEKSQ
jgi:hypothetical protein